MILLRPLLRDQRGSALLISLVMIVVITILGLALFELAQIEGQQAGASLGDARAFELAQAGMERAIRELSNGFLADAYGSESWVDGVNRPTCTPACETGVYRPMNLANNTLPAAGAESPHRPGSRRHLHRRAQAGHGRGSEQPDLPGGGLHVSPRPDLHPVGPGQPDCLRQPDVRPQHRDGGGGLPSRLSGDPHRAGAGQGLQHVVLRGRPDCREGQLPATIRPSTGGCSSRARSTSSALPRSARRSGSTAAPPWA